MCYTGYPPEEKMVMACMVRLGFGSEMVRITTSMHDSYGYWGLRLKKSAYSV